LSKRKKSPSKKKMPRMMKILMMSPLTKNQRPKRHKRKLLKSLRQIQNKLKRLRPKRLKPRRI
jgi:hypothetical protein